MKAPHSSFRRVHSRAFVLVATLLFALLLSAAPVSATEIEVGGDCTLAEAIANANNDNNGGGTGNGCAAGSGNDVINLTGDITLSAALPTITSTLTINGAAPNGGRYTLRGSAALGTNSLLTASGTPSSTTPITYTATTLTINNLILINNNGETATGGALRLVNSASADINGSSFTNNKTGASAAAIDADSTSGNLTISDSDFSGNASNDNGGAIYFSGSSTSLTISNSRFTKNTADSNGGAMHVGAFTTVNISGSIFTDNVATNGTGGALDFASTPGVGTVDISGSRFMRNVAGQSGGAIDSSVSSGFSLTVSNSVFSANSATNGGGAILADRTVNIYRSAFSDNQATGTSAATGRGGAILAFGATRLENSTFYNNTAVNEGGAFHGRTASAVVTIRHVTFVDNQSTGSSKNGNSVFFLANATGNMYNSIIQETKNSDGTSYGGDDCAGLDENSNNIIQDGSCDTGGTLSVDPKLYGRIGQVFPLAAGSPALDAASSMAAIAACNALLTVDGQRFDQRGVPRPVGEYCDLGAYEGFFVPTDTDSGGGNSAASTGEQLLTAGFRVWAQYGLHSGIQFQRHGAAAVGIQSLIDGGVLDVVDVWGYADQDWEVCFPQDGALVFLDAALSPRVPESVAAYRDEGYTCIAKDRAGMVVLHAGVVAASGRRAAVGRAGPGPAKLHGADELHPQLPRISRRRGHHPGALRCHADGAGADGGLVQSGLSRDAGLDQRASRDAVWRLRLGGATGGAAAQQEFVVPALGGAYEVCVP